MSEHTLDANILINLQRLYPRDIFEFLWAGMEQAVADGLLCVCENIHDEVGQGGDDLYDWVDNQQGFVCGVTQEEVDLATEISNDHPEWVQDRKNAGDPWIIAHAKEDGLKIVTEERRAGANVSDKNQKIPNVADEHSVACIRFFDLVRLMGWKAS